MSDRPVAWITGAAGLIGSHLVRSAPPGWRVSPITRERVDLTRFQDVTRLFEKERPRLIIHCAAMSRSPDCQQAPDDARLQNVAVTRHLTDLAVEAAMVFFSTDLVFDGRRGGYLETDPVKPLSIYGSTKVQAEELVLRHPRGLVVRTSLNGGPSPSGRRGVEEQMLSALQSGKTLHLFTDEFRCPIPAAATARAVWELVARRAVGLFHLAGAERMSRWDLGRHLVALRPEWSPRIRPASIRDYPGAPRAPDTSLNCDKVQGLISFPLPRFSEWLKERLS